MKSAIANPGGRYLGFALVLLPAFLVCGSMGFLASEALFLSEEERETGKWLLRDVLPYVLGNTLALVLPVVVGTAVVGIFQAFVVVHTNLPGRKWLNIFFILPLSFPLYVTAFVYVGLLEFGGPVSLGRWGGAVFVFILSLSPYVYLLAKGAFRAMGGGMVRSGKMLGYSPMAMLFAGVLPCARPWLLSGAVLVGLETLADFGAVSVFNYDTLTTAIYGTWKSLFSLSLASRLALILAVVALTIFSLESCLFKRGTFVSDHQPREAATLFHFALPGKSVLWALCTVWIVLSLFLPVGQLLVWAWGWAWERGWEDVEGRLLFNTFALALSGAALVSLWSLGMALYSQGRDFWAFRLLRHSALIGYAFPGTLLGVAVFAFFSRGLSLSPGTGGLLLLLCGYGIRFLSVGFRPLNVAAEGLPMGLLRAARVLGADGKKIFGKVYFPHLKGAFLASFLLAFVEVAKEMPMTLILRSPGQKTLAVKIYELTSEGEWEWAAPYGIVLVGLGALSLLFLNRFEGGVAR